MAAFFELAAALIAALVEAVTVVLQAMFIAIEAKVALLGIILEFVWLAITDGTASATEKFHQRRQAHRESLVAAGNTGTSPNSIEADLTSRRTQLQKGTIIACLIVVAVTSAFAITFLVREHVRQNRIEATQAQIAKLADKLIAQLDDQQGVDPQSGLLHERDAWQQPLQLSVDKGLLWSNVVVRSSGPDRQSGTLDDLLAKRTLHSSAEGVGAELTDRGLQAVRKQLDRLLPRKKEDPSKEDDVADE